MKWCPMKLLVRNLATATTEEKLKSLFVQYGAVQSCNLVLDKVTGKSKGFAFIEMPKAGEAKAAIKQLNGYKLAGNLIRVKKTEVKKESAETVVQTIKPTKPKAPKSTPKKEVEAPVELKSNDDNALNICGTIKKADDEF